MHRLAAQIVVLVAHHQRAATIQLLAIRQPRGNTLPDQYVRVDRHIRADHKLHTLNQRLPALPRPGVYVWAGRVGGVNTKATTPQPKLIGREVLRVQHGQLTVALLREGEGGGEARVRLEELVGVDVFFT